MEKFIGILVVIYKAINAIFAFFLMGIATYIWLHATPLGPDVEKSIFVTIISTLAVLIGRGALWRG